MTGLAWVEGGRRAFLQDRERTFCKVKGAAGEAEKRPHWQKNGEQWARRVTQRHRGDTPDSEAAWIGETLETLRGHREAPRGIAVR